MSERRMFILRRPFSSLLLLVVFMIAVLAWQYRVALQAFPIIISAYTAKEYCSCRYVMNNPADYCRSYVKQYIPATFTDDTLNKSVSASGLGRSSVATWQGARQGCRLLPEEP
ncbi:amidase [Pseudomonas sp. KFB-139]|uniref:Amidase n=1 Tax=Pseudomonas serbiensis TaxID=3064350 RepID=A0ABT9CSZ1_9PSED|nr:amidase [Pseudomonas sp. KFB-138]MDO7928617.1 amidase [Pseudomonas sp. KFB-138]